MITEPAIKRAVTFVDGQNLFYAVREAFGYTYPNYDVLALSRSICLSHGWRLSDVYFYTGIPDSADKPSWHHFWSAKLRSMSRQGIRVFSRPLRYRIRPVKLPDGSTYTFRTGQEKGIDVRLSLDVVRKAMKNEFDVAVLFTQDQDLSEVAEEIREIAREEGRWILVASAYPVSPTTSNRRGVNKTDWIKIDRSTYDACIDPYDYRSESP